MAPKAAAAKAAPAAAKPAPKPKAEPKEKKEKRPEDDIPAVVQPDRAAFDEAMQKIQDEITALQAKQQKITETINGRTGGKDDFQTKKAELRAQMSEYGAEMDKLQAAKEEINNAIGANRVEGQQMREQLNKMKKSIGFTSEQDIDERIATLEFKRCVESMTLKQEKQILAEIQELKRNKPKVSHVHQMEENLSSRDSGLPLKERIQNINAEMAVWREKKKAVSEEHGKLVELRKEQLGDMPQLIEERDGHGNQIRAKIQERNAARDKFREDERAYREYLGELRRIRAERVAEERAARQREFDQRRLLREAEKLDDQPYVAEITLVEQTISFCKGLTESKKKEEKKVVKETTFDNPDDTSVLIRKEDRDAEFYFAPTAKSKKNKAKDKAVSKGGEGSTSAKPIKHNAETFQLFDKLKLNAPITTDDIPALLEKLEAQLEHYNAKVADWEEKREEKKRLILETGKLPEDEKEEADEAAKEEPALESAKEAAAEANAEGGDDEAEEES